MKKRKFTDKEIKEIAENLDIGYKVFLNRKTLEIFDALDRDAEYYDPIPEAEAEWEKLEEMWVDLMEIQKMPAREAFQTMEEFAEQVSDRKLQNKLFNALSRSKPFRNFKNVVDNSSYRENWFAFKDEAYKNWVRRELRHYIER